ncbi:Porin P [Alphaproteobacteria bacterium SO-S41]|nr:Porin P [Alphaproteobacteria bacterium SO-S41]
MKLRLNLLAYSALTAAALVATTPVALAKEKTITVTESELRKMIAEEVRRQTGSGAAAAPANLEQRVSDLEISQGSKITALQTRADAVQWSFENGRPVISTGDGRFELAFRGRFHFDAGTFSQSPSNDVPYAYDGQNVRDLGSGSVFRRAQFGVEGKFFRDFDYEMRFNFGGTETEDNSALVNIMRVAYNPTPEIRINVGAIQPTFTLDDSTSSNDITFMERAAVVNAVIAEFGGSDARKGIEATYLKQGDNMDFMFNVAYTTSTTGGTTGTRQAVADDRDHLLGRFAARLFKNADWDVHVGANAATILSMGGVDTSSPTALPAARNLNFRDRPELRIAGERLVATGNIPAESAWMWGLEAGVRYKNFYASGEYFSWGVDRDRACIGCNVLAPDPEFNGYYVMASYILTGETKRYEAQNRSNSRMQFGAPRPNSPFSTGGTWGAWEIAARYSVLDLDYNVNPLGLATIVAPNANLGEIRGGQQSITSVDLNWYLNRNMRVMFSYQHVDVDRLSSTALSAATNPTAPSAAYPNIGQQYDAFAIRTQFAF